MKIKAKDLETIICNCQLNKGNYDYLRDRIGSALCRVLYDYAGDRYDNDDTYKLLGEATFYNCPSEEEIMMCFDYMSEHNMMNVELTLNFD